MRSKRALLCVVGIETHSVFASFSLRPSQTESRLGESLSLTGSLERKGVRDRQTGKSEAPQMMFSLEMSRGARSKELNGVILANIFEVNLV